jgi:hypothetical protein
MSFRQVETHSVASPDGCGNRMHVKVPWMMSPRGKRLGLVTTDGDREPKTQGVSGWQQRDICLAKSWGLTRFCLEHKENIRAGQ